MKMRYIFIALIIAIAAMILVVGTRPFGRQDAPGKPSPHALDQSGSSS